MEIGTNPIYIGDGVYVLINSNYQFELYTHRTNGERHSVYINGDNVATLKKIIEEMFYEGPQE